MNRLVLFGICIIATLFCFGQSSFEAKEYQSGQYSLLYQVLLPDDYDPDKSYPLVLFLHGAGERGSDNKKQLVHGAKLFENAQKEYPSIVVFPQCPEDDYWSNLTIDRSKRPYKLKFDYSDKATVPMKLVMELLDSLKNTATVDKNRIYVGGLSMGGMGTLEILSRRPNTFAAAFSICGAGDPKSVSAYAQNTPIWFFHGAKDDLILSSYSADMVIALRKAGADPKYTLYKNANHNSWDPAFAEPEFLDWLYGQ